MGVVPAHSPGTSILQQAGVIDEQLGEADSAGSLHRRRRSGARLADALHGAAADLRWGRAGLAGVGGRCAESVDRAVFPRRKWVSQRIEALLA